MSKNNFSIKDINDRITMMLVRVSDLQKHPEDPKSQLKLCIMNQLIQKLSKSNHIEKDILIEHAWTRLYDIEENPDSQTTIAKIEKIQSEIVLLEKAICNSKKQL